MVVIVLLCWERQRYLQRRRRLQYPPPNFTANKNVSTDTLSSHHENLSSSRDSTSRGSTHDVSIDELSEIEKESLRQAEDDVFRETQKFGLPTVTELL